MQTTIANKIKEVPWFVLVVKGGTEKKVATKLQQINIDVFCPFQKETRQWSDRKKVVEVPLFPRYVFIRIADKDRNIAFSVPGVLKYLFWAGKPAIPRAEEIEVVKAWLADSKITSLHFSHLKPGKVIHIESGLFKNKQAIIQQVRKNEVKLVLHGLGLVVFAKIKDVA